MNFSGGPRRRERAVHLFSERRWADHFLRHHRLKQVDDELIGLFLSFDIFRKDNHIFAPFF
jgi:hypothetical protein